MATVIQIHCPECRATNSVPADALLAMVDLEDDLNPQPGGEVVWICVRCESAVTARVAWRCLLALISAGVPLLESDGDADNATERPPHPECPGPGQAFTLDDLLELHEELAEQTWFSTLVEISDTPFDRSVKK
jgi:hypothetical protein